MVKDEINIVDINSGKTGAETVNEMFGVAPSATEEKEVLEKYIPPVEEPYKEEKPVDCRGIVGDNIIDTPEELMNLEVNVSFFKLNFWDLWFQKVFRNFASMKFQLLIILYIPIIWGMFNINPGTNLPWISATLGLSFLGGGYVTLATSRYLSRTGLVEKNTNSKFDTEQ